MFRHDPTPQLAGEIVMGDVLPNPWDAGVKVIGPATRQASGIYGHSINCLNLKRIFPY